MSMKLPATIAILLCVCVITSLMFAVLTDSSWIKTSTTKCGLTDCTLSGDNKDVTDTALGLLAASIGLAFFALIAAILLLVAIGPAKAVAGGGAAISLVAMVLTIAGWAHYTEHFGDEDNVDWQYGYLLAVVAWVLLLLLIPVFIIMAMSADEGNDGAQEATKAKQKAAYDSGKLSPAGGEEHAAAGEAGADGGDGTELDDLGIVPVSPHGMGELAKVEDLELAITVEEMAENVVSLSYHDYNVDDEGNPVPVTEQKGQFRCAGDSFMEFGFQLTANEKAKDQCKQQGHFMCLVEFETAGSEVHLRFEYNMCGENKGAGAGLCAYLLDPSLQGWDTEFNGSGPMGFIGKTAAIVGVALDNTGDFSGGPEKEDHLSIKRVDGSMLETRPVPGGFMTGEDEWKTVHVKFDIKDLKIDVSLDGNKILDDVKLEGISIPNKLCVAVCGASTDPDFMISVNDVKLEDVDDVGESHVHQVHAEEQDAGEGIPKGCTDFKVVNGALEESDQEEVWRIAGNTKVYYGFELTQDEDDQQGHLICRMPFEVPEGEVHASLTYVMEPKAYTEGGGQGLCVYLLDPEVPGWDRQFNGQGPLGFVGKTGAILGVGIDCTGEFCEGQPASVAVKRASDSKLLCDPVAIEKQGDLGVDGVKTGESEWRKVKIKFDIEESRVHVMIGGYKYLDTQIDLGQDEDGNPIKIPNKLCIGVCAGTANGRSNHICVNSVKLEAEEDDD